MNKETFCSYPFDTIFLGADAGIKTCCSANQDIGDLNKDRIEDILASDKAQEIRQSILDEKWHDSCQQCKILEDQGARSERTSSIEHTYDYYESIELDSTFFGLKKLDLRWSNVCNLACNYCYEYFSSQWAKIKGVKLNTLDGENEESLFEFIDIHKDEVETVNLLGGEPLLQRQNERLISMLPTNTNYYMLTNMAVPLEKNSIMNLLLNEEAPTFGISFETIGDKYEYVRHGASWEVFCNNIKTVKEKNPSVRLNAHPLYCTYSAFNLVEYYEFVLNAGFDDIYWCSIQNIEGLNIIKLSKELKTKAIKEIEKCSELFPEQPSIKDLINIKISLEKSLDDVIATDTSEIELFAEFTTGIELQLKNKKKKATELWPELFLENAK